MKSFRLLLVVNIFLMSSVVFAATYQDGALLKERNGSRIYEIKNGYKIPIPDASVIGGRKVIEVSSAELTQIPDMPLQTYKSVSAQPYGAASNGQATKSYEQAGMQPTQTINAYASGFNEDWRASDRSARGSYQEKASERIVNFNALSNKIDAANKETFGIGGIQYYGYWCGEGWSGGVNGKSEPINSIDAACKVHDEAYVDVDKKRNEADTWEAKALELEMANGLKSTTADSTPPLSQNLIPHVKQILEEANRLRKKADDLRKEANTLEKDADIKLVGEMKTAKNNLASEFAAGKGGSFYGDIEEDKKFADCAAIYFNKKVNSSETIAKLWALKCMNGQSQAVSSKAQPAKVVAISVQKSPMNSSATASLMPTAQQLLDSAKNSPLLKKLPPPTVSRIAPSSGAPGITLVFYGNNLNPDDALVSPKVVFNTRPAISYLSAHTVSNNELRVTVPPGNGSVTVYVDTAGGRSSDFTFTYQAPVITDISPSSGRRGDMVTITGKNFGVKQAVDPSDFVKFGDSPANPIQWNDQKIVVKAPSDFGTGTNLNIFLDLAGCIANPSGEILILNHVLPGCDDLIQNFWKKYQLSTNPGFLEKRVPILVHTEVGTSNQGSFTFRVQTHAQLNTQSNQVKSYTEPAKPIQKIEVTAQSMTSLSYAPDAPVKPSVQQPANTTLTQKAPTSNAANMLAANTPPYDLASCLGPELQRKILMPISSRDEFLRLEKEVMAEVKRICGGGQQQGVAPIQQANIQQNQIKAYTETVKPNQGIGFAPSMAPALGAGEVPATPLKGEMKVVNEGRFYDQNYNNGVARQLWREHIGTDYVAVGGTQVYATRTGRIVEKNNPPDPYEAVVIVQHPDGSRAIYGHIESALPVGFEIKQGSPIGTVRHSAPQFHFGAHLHYGENLHGKASVEKSPDGWGWGRVPYKTGLSEIMNRGWVNAQEKYGWGSVGQAPLMATQHPTVVAAAPRASAPALVQPNTQPALPPPAMQAGNPSQHTMAPAVAITPAQPPAANMRPNTPLPVAAAQAQPVAPMQPTLAPQKAPIPAPVLQFNGFASSYATASTPYQPTISLNGSGFNSVTQINWTCAMPNGASCGVIPSWTPANWNGKFIRYSDTAASVSPSLLLAGDPAGTYRWTATFHGAGQPVVWAFTVTNNALSIPTGVPNQRAVTPVVAAPIQPPVQPAYPLQAQPLARAPTQQTIAQPQPPIQAQPINTRPSIPLPAMGAQPAATHPPAQSLQKAPAPVTALQFSGFASNYSAASTPYQPTISLNGSGFNSVTQINWTCAMPNGVSCGAIPTWTPANWNGKFIRYSDTSAVVAPMLLVASDPRGTYRWTATFHSAGQPVTKSFAVTKN